VQPQRFPNAPTCVWQLEELGLVELMQGEHTLTRDLTAVPTPGHTPGHMSILITSRGERALVLGDAAHSPVQIHEPDWVSRADMDPDLTRQTRRALIDRLEREEIPWPPGTRGPGFGRIVRPEGRRYWRGLRPIWSRSRAARRALAVRVRSALPVLRRTVDRADGTQRGTRLAPVNFSCLTLRR
jgi:glyoxylase-like metal-dependent hydrolase (beta-lactamase superfamily II)